MHKYGQKHFSALIKHAFYAATILATGCSTAAISNRNNNAADIAQHGALQRFDITAAPFILASWQKFSVPSAPIHIYIEGDGLAWLSRNTPSDNPTPKHPIALDLAAQDNTSNVVYLARPCQFTAFSAQNKCSKEYWMGKRFAREVIDAYHAALNQLTAKHPTSKFNLIGYSGGANIAGILAAERDDIIDLRTVAGNIDNDYFTTFHKVSAMPLSLNMANYAQKLEHIPQYHFIAEKDKFVPAEIAENYRHKIQKQNCLQTEIIHDTTHSDGWIDLWPTLLQKKPLCR